MRNLTKSFLLLALATPASAQEGLEMGKMWTFENPPLAYLEKEYGFKPDQKWLNSLRLASLRYGRGCSASFVSPKGLIMTNHHCARGNIAGVQGANDWVKDGFYATKLEDEVRLPGLTVQQLISSKDVTNEINAGVKDSDSDEDRNSKIEANKSKVLTAAREEHPELQPQIITMHQGVVYQLYMYRIYRDIRLVHAPHLQTSHFGGDPDNFTYPRFGLDYTFVRAYIDGKPADTKKHYFRWSTSGPKQNELAFVTGNPGSTGRLLTEGQMGFLRDADYPMRVAKYVDELSVVKPRAAKDAAYEKRVRTFILSVENSRKAIQGYLDGLNNPNLQAAKDKYETEFREKVAADETLHAKYGNAWEELEKISRRKTELLPILNFYIADYSKEVGRALAMVRATDPAADPKVKSQAAGRARAKIRPSRVADALYAKFLGRAVKWLGKDDPVVQLLVGSRSFDAAVEAIKSSAVADDAKVDELLKGGREAIENSSDHVIRAALLMADAHKKAAAESRKLSVREKAQGALIGKALFAVYGNAVSPDATFSLRFSDGRVKGFPYNGTLAPYRTTFYGLYARNAEFDNEYPFNLPQIWLDRKNKIDLKRGVNFVATNDIIGGNSGSPIVNAKQEVIGLIFDGNIEMLGNRFLYKDDVPRSVSVHSDAILEAMAKIYDARRIVEEIQAGSK